MYQFSMFFIRIFLKIVFFLRVRGKENLVNTGGVVICANHTSNWDPLFVASATKRHIHYMAKSELFESAIGGWYMNACEIIPVKRDTNDITAIKRSLAVVKKGGVLGLFPEGTRHHTDNSEAKAGVTMIAIKAGGAVQPVAIRGEVKPFHRVEVIIGKPIYYDKAALGKLQNEDYHRLANDVMNDIREMLHD